MHRALLLALLAGPSALAQSVVVAPSARGADSIFTAAASSGFTGVALILKDGQPVLRKAWGLAQREGRVAFTPSTVVQVGSNTKDFTALAIMQLVARGRLRVEDSLARFFPDAPADKRAITVRQLLNHRAGLPIGIAPDPELVTRDEFQRRVFAVALASPPGTREQYSNAGYSLLALIIETVTGMSYDAYLRDNVLAPLGLTRTGYALPAFDRRTVAHGYTGSEDKGTILDFPHPADGPSWTLRGNGGMLSSVDEMAVFYRALFTTERLLPAGVRNRLWNPDEPAVLAGSDLTSYFICQREPQAGLEFLVASTQSSSPAPRLLRAVVATFGIQPPTDEQRGIAPNAPAITLPDSPAAATIREYLAVFNRADSAAAEVFFRERALPAPDGTPTTVRAGRMTQAAGNLGALTPVAYRVLPDGRHELSARTASGEAAVLIFDIEPAVPHRLRGLAFRVGG